MKRIQGAAVALALVASAGFSASTMAETAAEEGQRLLGWRDVREWRGVRF